MKKLIILLSFLLISTTASANFINIRADGEALLDGGLKVGAIIGLTSKFGIGGSITSSKVDSSSSSGYEVNLDYFFKSFSSDGLFLEAMYAGSTTTIVGSTLEPSSSSMGLYLGYQYFLGSLLNLQLGVGYVSTTADTTISIFGTSSTISTSVGGVDAMLNLGVSF